MPTPRDATVDGPALTDVERPSRNRFSSFNSFTGCPPDDERPHGATREDTTTRADTPQATSTTDALPVDHESADELRDERDDLQQLLAQHEEEDAPARTISDRITTAEVQISKADHIEDAGILVEPSSPLLLDTTRNGDDAHLAQSMSTAAISPSTPSPEYLHFPDAYQDRTKSSYSTTSFLRPGSKFRGTQQSDRQVYDVQVEIKDVDLAESFLCGYLRIQGLTDDHPTLTTFFEGEIIGSKYLFKTGHPSWNSSEKIDMQHWGRFPAWRPLAKAAKVPSFTLKDYQQREHLFMRWKEYFLVPDHRVKTITGASFEGFYYICFNQSSGNVSGIYFHAKSEKYQQLELKHVDDRGCMPAIEFR